MKRDLPYWKGRLIDARDAFRRNRTREYQEAVRFALRKIRGLEKNAFKIGEIE